MQNLTAEDYLQFMMDFQGNLFTSRQKCLNHLFVTFGNGYEWEDGCLVARSMETKELLNRWNLAFHVIKAKPRSSCVEIANIEQSMYERRGIQVPKWSQLSKEYSYLYNYPDNIREDWLALLNECKKMLIEDGIEV